MPTPEDEFAEALDAAMSDLAAHKAVYCHEDELLAAGDFVTQFGALADLFGGESLIQAQTWVDNAGPAWSLLSHWSIMRGDGFAQPPPDNYQAHLRDCEICAYLEGAANIRAALQAYACTRCKRGVDDHDVAPSRSFVDGRTDDLVVDWFQPRAWCRAPWERPEPAVVPLYDDPQEEGQVGDAWQARWRAPLADGTFAWVTRTYYLTQDRTVRYVERRDEYLITPDRSTPTNSDVSGFRFYTEVDSDDPDGEDVEALADESFAPERGEWEINVPNSPDFAWTR